MTADRSLEPSSQFHEGICHCGAIGFQYRTALEPREWPIRACQCTFGRKTADFWICRKCGAYIGVTMESGGSTFGVVNVRLLPSLFGRLQAPQPMHYESEGSGERVARREARWTPIDSDRQQVGPS